MATFHFFLKVSHVMEHKCNVWCFFRMTSSFCWFISPYVVPPKWGHNYMQISSNIQFPITIFPPINCIKRFTLFIWFTWAMQNIIIVIHLWEHLSLWELNMEKEKTLKT